MNRLILTLIYNFISVISAAKKPHGKGTGKGKIDLSFLGDLAQSEGIAVIVVLGIVGVIVIGGCCYFIRKKFCNEE